MGADRRASPIRLSLSLVTPSYTLIILRPIKTAPLLIHYLIGTSCTCYIYTAKKAHTLIKPLVLRRVMHAISVPSIIHPFNYFANNLSYTQYSQLSQPNQITPRACSVPNLYETPPPA